MRAEQKRIVKKTKNVENHTTDWGHSQREKQNKRKKGHWSLKKKTNFLTRAAERGGGEILHQKEEGSHPLISKDQNERASNAWIKKAVGGEVSMGHGSTIGPKKKAKTAKRLPTLREIREGHAMIREKNKPEKESGGGGKIS